MRPELKQKMGDRRIEELQILKQEVIMWEDKGEGAEGRNICKCSAPYF